MKTNPGFHPTLFVIMNMASRTFLGILVMTVGANVIGATTRRGKELAANVNDSVWALNKDTVMLNCSHPDTNGDVWSQRAPDGTVSSVPPSHVKAFVGGSMLTVSMSPSLNGTSYRCVLTDLDVNRIFESGWITVLLGDEINMTCASQATVCATETQTLMKRCTISGLPVPNITVQKMSGPASSLPSASLSGLTFNAVKLEDRGVYTLTGENILEEKRVDVSVRPGVDICVAPMMVNISIPDTIFCLNLVLINYTAKGIPAPNITWNSSVAERAIVHAPNRYLTGITSFVESTLNITAQREDDHISFCVTAENSVARTSQCYSRNVTCSPGAPIVQVVDKGNTSFDLTILEPQFNGGNEVLSFNISVNNSDTQMGTYNVKRTGKETLYVVKGLSPNTSYTISVTSVNDIGEGPPFIFDNETAAQPERVEKDDVVLDEDCDGLLCRFNEIDDNGGAIANHRVLLYSKENTEVPLRQQSSSSSTVNIDGLESKRTYAVRLQVENEYGESVLSAAFFVTTDSCGLGTGPIVGISLGVVVVIAGCAAIIIVVKKKKSSGRSKGSSQELKPTEKKPPIVVDHDVKVEEAQYAITGPNPGKEDNGADGGRYTGSSGPIPGSVNNPSPKEVKHTKGPAGDNYAQLDKEPPKEDYAKPDVTKKRKAQKEVYADLDHKASGKAAAKPSPKVVDKSERTIYADMNPEQPKPRDHYDP